MHNFQTHKKNYHRTITKGDNVELQDVEVGYIKGYIMTKFHDADNMVNFDM